MKGAALLSNLVPSAQQYLKKKILAYMSFVRSPLKGPLRAWSIYFKAVSRPKVINNTKKIDI